MLVLISVDMEGLAGVATSSDVTPGEDGYERSRVLMTEEANAAVRGAHAFATDVETLVVDSHGPTTNILPERLDERARLIRGRPRELAMMSGIDGAGAALFVGYHGKFGTARSVLSHTYNSSVNADIRCNGVPLGEIGINAALAAHYEVPVALVCGDDTVAREAESLMAGVSTVVVKKAVGARAADSLHPAEACRRIEAAVPDALAKRHEIGTVSFQGPVELEVDVHREHMLENCLYIPDIRRIGPRTVAYSAVDYPAAFRIIRLVIVLAAAQG